MNRQPALFAPTRSVPDVTQVIIDGLRDAGYGSVTVEEAKAVHRLILDRYGTKVRIGYVRSMAANRSLGEFLDQARAIAAKTASERLSALREAGDCPHDSHAEICPECRAEPPEPAPLLAATAEDVATALKHFRSLRPEFGLVTLGRISTTLHAYRRRGADLATLLTVAEEIAREGQSTEVPHDLTDEHTPGAGHGG